MNLIKTLLSVVVALMFLQASAVDEPKSDYYFMEGLRQRALGNDDAYMRLMERSYELNPDPAGESAKIISFARMALAGADSLAFSSALNMAAHYVAANPSDTYAGVTLADIYSRAGLFDLALPIYATADSVSGGNPGVAMRHASALERAGKFDEALEVYRGIERREGRRPQLTFAISRLLMIQTNDTAAALAEVDDLVRALPLDIQALTLAVSAYQTAKRPEEALRLADRAVEIDPYDEDLLQYRIQIAADIYGPEGALDAFTRTVESDEIAPETKARLLGFFAGGLDQISDSAYTDVKFRAADVVERVMPDSPTAYVMRARLFLEEKDYGNAISELRAALDVEPDLGWIWGELIRVYVLNDQSREAVKAGEEALLIPGLEDDADVRYMLSGAYLNLKDYKGAARAIRPLTESEELGNEGRGDMLAILADAEQNFKPLTEVIPLYEKALELSPANIMAKNNYAYMLAEYGGDLSRAEALINQVLETGARIPIYLDTAAWIAFRQGKYGPAIELIDEALARETDPEPEFLLHAGDIYFRAGMTDKALEFWQQGLEKEPDSADLRKRVELKRIPE